MGNENSSLAEKKTKMSVVEGRTPGQKKPAAGKKVSVGKKLVSGKTIRSETV